MNHTDTCIQDTNTKSAASEIENQIHMNSLGYNMFKTKSNHAKFHDNEKRRIERYLYAKLIKFM